MSVIYILTGLSGAGKTQATRIFEDMGFYCVDNLPPALIGNFTDLVNSSDRNKDRVVLVIDIRGGEFFDDLSRALDMLDEKGQQYKIIYFEAEDETLVRRFKETRRKHPLSGSGMLLEGIAQERKRLEALRNRADFIMDTTRMTPWQLKQEMVSTFMRGREDEVMTISVISFGYKYGLPLDTDFAFDVRFLPNPHYEPSMREKTGEDREVMDFVLQAPACQTLVRKIADLLFFVIPQNMQEGKAHLAIAVGCTGGRHRSVAIARELVRILKENGFKALLQHRDIHKA